MQEPAVTASQSLNLHPSSMLTPCLLCVRRTEDTAHQLEQPWSGLQGSVNSSPGDEVGVGQHVSHGTYSFSTSSTFSSWAPLLLVPVSPLGARL